MKKFSNITGQKVGQEPKIETQKINEEDLFKAKVMNLMDQLLSIRTYGPVDRYQRAGNIKIAGKEMFLEALLDLLSDKSLKDQAKLLESLKSNVKEWDIIDSRIDEVNTKISESKEKNKTISHRNKLDSLYNNYKNDEDLLLQMVENSSNKIKSADSAHLRAITAEYMSNEGKYPKELFSKISEKFHNRAQQLGYTK